MSGFRAPSSDKRECSTAHIHNCASSGIVHHSICLRSLWFVAKSGMTAMWWTILRELFPMFLTTLLFSEVKKWKVKSKMNKTIKGNLYDSLSLTRVIECKILKYDRQVFVFGFFGCFFLGLKICQTSLKLTKMKSLWGPGIPPRKCCRSSHRRTSNHYHSWIQTQHWVWRHFQEF